jgi:hypothetical protein
MLTKDKKSNDEDKKVLYDYQKDDIIQFADISGDSLELSRRAANEKKEFIIFCSFSSFVLNGSHCHQSVYIIHFSVPFKT